MPISEPVLNPVRDTVPILFPGCINFSFALGSCCCCPIFQFVWLLLWLLSSPSPGCSLVNALAGAVSITPYLLITHASTFLKACSVFISQNWIMRCLNCLCPQESKKYVIISENVDCKDLVVGFRFSLWNFVHSISRRKMCQEQEHRNVKILKQGRRVVIKYLIGSWHIIT